MQRYDQNISKAVFALTLLAGLGLFTLSSSSYGQQWNPSALEEQTSPPTTFANQEPILITKPTPSSLNEASNDEGQKVIPRPKPKTTRDKIEEPTPTGSPVLAETSIPVTVLEAASSASFNDEMITNKPGLQDPANYPLFKNPANGKVRACILSGFERRTSVDPSGNTTYEGTLPNLRMVVSDLVDIPSWHPPESGCIISIHQEYKK